MTPITAVPAVPADTEPRARFRDLVTAEWLKLWSLRSTPWTLGLTALAIVAANAEAARSDYRNFPRVPPADRADSHIWALNDAFTSIASTALMLVAGTVGALAIVSEYSSGLARTTFAAVPARRSVVAAKAVVVTAVMTGYGVLVAGVSFALTQAILSGRDIDVSFGDPAAQRVVVASALLAPVCALVGMGIGALLRHGAGSVVATMLVLLVLPMLFDERRRWSAAVQHAMPASAWDRLVDPGVRVAVADHPATITGSWLVYAAWSLAGVLLAAAVVHRRDL